MSTRTSASHPLRVDWLDVGLPRDRVGMTIAPGKHGRSQAGFTWARDLDGDLDRLVADGVEVLVCLLEDHELPAAGIPELVGRARARGLEVLRLPIPDGGVPDDGALVELLETIESRVHAGRKVVVHCMGGLGRTGTVAGCLLVRAGLDVEAALAALVRVRGDRRCPENDRQKDVIRRIARRPRRAVAVTPSASSEAAPSPAGWYATQPRLLAAPEDRARHTAEMTRSAPVPARRLAAELEEFVARDPRAAFSFGVDGTATLHAGERVHAAGRFTTPSIGALRAGLVRSTAPRAPRARLSVLHGRDPLTDIGALQASAPDGVLFQVASQFNCLEAPGPHVVPVRQYVTDPTQGPRASVSALAGTLLRHHAAPGPDGERFTQSSARCLDLLGDVLQPAIAQVRSGYLSTETVHDLPATAEALTAGFERIRLGVHDDVEVMLGHDWDGVVSRPGARIAQVFTSTLALGGYGHDDGSRALVLARRQLLRAAYVGTLMAAATLGKHTVVLTLIGGGVFGNPRAAIWEAIHHALDEVDPLLPAPLHVVVNTREELDPADADRARARGGFVARFDPGGVTVDG